MQQEGYQVEEGMLVTDDGAVPVQDVIGIFLWVSTVKRKKGAERIAFKVAAVVKPGEVTSSVLYDEVRSSLEKASVPHGEEISDGRRQMIARSLADMGDTLRGSYLVMSKLEDEWRAWQMAKRAARELKVELADFTQPRAVAIPCDQLGLSLGSRLAKHGLRQPDPGERPPGVTERIEDDRLVIGWQHSWWGCGVFCIAFLAVVVAIPLGLSISGWMGLVLPAIVAGAGVLVRLILILLGDRKNEVFVGADRIGHVRFFPSRRERSMSLHDLERIANPNLESMNLRLMSDSREIVCGVDMDEAPWIVLRLQAHLVERYLAGELDA